MIKRFILILILFGAFPAVVFSSESQRGSEAVSHAGMEYASSYEELNYIKSSIQELLVENKKLQDQYDKLKQEYDGLFLQLDDEQKKIEEKKTKDREHEQYMNFQAGAVDELSKTVDELKNEILLMESKVYFFQGELIDIEERKRLLELKLTDLNYEKREKELEAKAKEESLSQIKETYSSKIQDLQKTLDERLQEEKNLQALILQLEQEQMSSPVQEEGLREEIGRLEEELLQLNDLKVIKDTEAALINNKLLLEERTTAPALQSKREKKASLEETVSMLEKEYNQLQEKVYMSMDKKKFHDKLIHDVIAIDKENQQLREEISKLQKKINELTQ